jgi:AcrR family transcriptional regulator
MPTQRQDPEFARLRKALIELCFERGFDALTPAQLLERAEVDGTTFERRFGDLETLFFEVYLGELERFKALMLEARSGEADWRTRIRASAYALYGFLADDERVTNFVAVEVRRGGERARLLFEAEITALVDLIDEGRQELEDPESVSRSTAESVAGGIFNQIYAIAGPGGSKPPAPKVIQQLMYAVVLPYLGPEAAQEELEIEPPAGRDR